MQLCEKRISDLLVSLIMAAFGGALALSAWTSASRADVDPKFDWKDKKRHLKVCLESTGCPAGMADSVKAAINLWNAKLVSWQLEYTSDCGAADVKIKCGSMPDLGRWRNAGGPYGASTKSEITIKKDGNWGYCNDKLEIVSTIAHELGHAMRLNDVSGQSKLMRGSQGPAGHLRGPMAADSTEASTADGTTVAKAQTTPPGGKKQSVYTGMINSPPGTDPMHLMSAMSVHVTPFRPSALTVLGSMILGDDLLQWSAEINSDAEGVEAFQVVIAYPESVSVRDGYLRVAEPWWNEAWVPGAVAPNDTVVPFDTSMVILDATRSFHSSGLPEVMIFQWDIDGPDIVIKGEPITSTTLAQGEHTIILHAIDRFGHESIDAMNVTVVDATTGAEVPKPQGFKLNQNYPNPFNPYTVIRYDLPVECRVAIEIFDVSGAKVATLVDAFQKAGGKVAVWNGTDASGRMLASGVYFYRMTAGQYTETRKLVLIR